MHRERLHVSSIDSELKVCSRGNEKEWGVRNQLIGTVLWHGCGVESGIIRSVLKNCMAADILNSILMRHHHERSIKLVSAS